MRRVRATKVPHSDERFVSLPGNLVLELIGVFAMIPMIDLFAGPGGLSEGFSSVLTSEGLPLFSSIMSVERDPQAHKTLRLRTYFRKLYYAEGKVPTVYLRYLGDQSAENLDDLINYRPDLWDEASFEALCAELRDGDDTLVSIAKERLIEHNAFANPGTLQPTENTLPWILIGGPPCQAYSLAGRSRRAHDTTLETDEKQTLYRCYLQFIQKLQPTVFVMENVKGLISAQQKGESLFFRIKEDMEEAGYTVKSLVSTDPKAPRDYIIQSERYGIPQKRHRVILLGVKQSFAGQVGTLRPSPEVTLRDVLYGIPALRSSFSQRANSSETDWVEFVKAAARNLIDSGEVPHLTEVLRRVEYSVTDLPVASASIDAPPIVLKEWYRGRLGKRRVLANHEARSHQPSDIVRYLYCSAFGEANLTPARISDFPISLLPEHRNVQDMESSSAVKFNDRFRVQVWNQPATTITAHISKDGHYYIHPRPEEARSLTVREAARLQTFPDDYIFEGNRTSQYTQVGNAVPPLLASQIATVVAEIING